MTGPLFGVGKLFHQEGSASALDLTGDLAVKTGRHTGDTAWQDFSALRDKTLEKIGIFIIDGFEVEIHATAWHGAVRPTEV